MLTEYRKAVLRAWYAKNREARLAKHKAWRLANRERLRAWKIANKSKIFLQKKAYRARHSDEIKAKRRADYLKDGGASAKARAKRWKGANVERVRENERKWRVENHQRHLASKRKYWLKKKQNPFKLLNHRMGRLMGNALRSKSGKAGISWRLLTGYSVEELHAHLERKFTGCMSWPAFMRGEIHIDHVRPISWFVYSSPQDEEFRKCWALSNLQPLWAHDNLTKQARWAG